MELLKYPECNNLAALEAIDPFANRTPNNVRIYDIV